MKRVIIPTAGFWAVFLVMQVYYFLSAGGWHPSYVPLLLFAVALVLLFSIAVPLAFWRLAAGPRRVETFGWFALLLLPTFVMYSQISLHFALQDSVRTEAYEPRIYMAPCGTMLEALIDGFVQYRLPYRVEGERVILFHDYRTSDPQSHVDEMDAFLKAEEEFFGVTMPAKLHWVRDSVFGQPGFAPAGIAVADPSYDHGNSPDPRFPLLNHIDRHESSHNVSFSALEESSPPMMLFEGWAESRTTDWEMQARRCLATRDAGCLLTMREMVSPRYYYSADERVYYQGAVLAHLLIEKFGPQKFVELFSTCTPETFADDVKKIYDMTLDELDEFCLREIDSHFSFEQATAKLSDEEKQRLEEFRKTFREQEAAFDELLASCTIRMSVQSTAETKPATETVVIESDYLFQSRGGDRYRIDTRTHSNESEQYPYDLQATFMILPHRHYTVSRWDCPPDYLHATMTDAQYIPDRKLQKTHLDVITGVFRPGTVLNDKSLDAILWRPAPGTTVESVIESGDGLVVVAIQYDGGSQREWYRMTLDPARNWALLEITWTRPKELLAAHVVKETREYEGEFQGVPLPKSCTVDENDFVLLTSQEIRKVHKTFEKIEISPGQESVFTEASLGVGKIKVTGTPTRPFDRMDRHLCLIAGWFAASVLLIAFARRRRKSQTPNIEAVLLEE